MAGERVVINDHAIHRLAMDRHGGVARKLHSLGLQVESRAKQLCPVDTGRLRGSITTQLAERNDELVCVVGSAVEYASYVENGTIYMEGFHFLADAVAGL